MKKLIFSLSMITVLTACSSEPPVKDENELPPGIMQAVAGTGAVEGGSWMPEIEQQSMPADMK
ncbi:MAG TPA: hypothetical protein DD638_11160 [Pasteurellaceae bacterium]|nr:hypothetical protein [Pasteurellaceae bacterium]